MVEGRGVESAEAGAVLLCRAASPRLMLRSTRGLVSPKRKYKMSAAFECSFSRARDLLHLRVVCSSEKGTSIALEATKNY